MSAAPSRPASGRLPPSARPNAGVKLPTSGEYAPRWLASRRGWGWYEARRVAGRKDLRFHDLRHGALTEAARHGATLAELMALGGHSTSQAALRYQQSASERLTELARKRAEARGWSADP